MNDEKRRILKERARILAGESSPPVGEAQSVEVITFLLAHETYGIESRYVREVNPIKEITPVPCTPRFVRGIINVRGRILSVIDLKAFLDLPEQGPAELNRVIVVEDDAMEFGILADQVLGVASLNPDAIQPLPSAFGGPGSEFIKGVAPQTVIFLDISKLLHAKDVMVHDEVAV
jgi:purine-binding chemotaxis protein CheW